MYSRYGPAPNQQQQQNRQANFMRCGFCAGKNPGNRIAFTHNLRDASGCNVCPFLAVNICNLCMLPGHTAKNCTYDADMLGVRMDASCRIDTDIEDKLKAAQYEFKVISAKEHLWLEHMRMRQSKTKTRDLHMHMNEHDGEIKPEFMEERQDFMWCKFCYNKNTRDPICATHMTYDPVTNKPRCPNLLCTRCPKCDQMGHTARFCKGAQTSDSPKIEVDEEVLAAMGDLSQYELDFDAEMSD